MKGLVSNDIITKYVIFIYAINAYRIKDDNYCNYDTIKSE